MWYTTVLITVVHQKVHANCNQCPMCNQWPMWGFSCVKDQTVLAKFREMFSRMATILTYIGQQYCISWMHYIAYYSTSTSTPVAQKSCSSHHDALRPTGIITL